MPIKSNKNKQISCFNVAFVILQTYRQLSPNFSWFCSTGGIYLKCHNLNVLLSLLDSFSYFPSCQKSEYPMCNNLGLCLEVAQNLYQTDFTPTYFSTTNRIWAIRRIFMRKGASFLCSYNLITFILSPNK